MYHEPIDIQSLTAERNQLRRENLRQEYLDAKMHYALTQVRKAWPDKIIKLGGPRLGRIPGKGTFGQELSDRVFRPEKEKDMKGWIDDKLAESQIHIET